MPTEITFDTRIAVFTGHVDVAPEPDWTGTILAFSQANEDFTQRDIADLRIDPKRRGEHRIGGGAGGCFTIRVAAVTA